MDLFQPSYTDAQLDEVRKAVRQQLGRMNAGAVLENLLSELQLHNQSDVHPVRPDQALQLLQEKGVVDQLARSITAPPMAIASITASRIQQGQPTKPVDTTAGCRPDLHYLHIKLLGARALVDYVARSPYPGEKLRLSVELFGHRLNSDWVPACAEPQFTGELMVPIPLPSVSGNKATSRPTELGKTQAQLGAASQPAATQGSSGGPQATQPMGQPDPLQLLTVRQPMHLALLSSALDAQSSTSGTQLDELTSSTPNSSLPWPSLCYSAAPCQVVALGAGDWRTALLRKRPVTVSVQLSSGPGVVLGLPAGSSPAGMATLQLSLRPACTAGLDESLLQVQQRTEAARDAQCAAVFVQQAKCWWAEFVRKHPNMHTRPVKVMAKGEDGGQYPSCSFVRPLQLGRALTGPQHAARFVSLMRVRDPTDSLDSVTAGQQGAECWCCLHTLLSSRAGSSEELALLLCSLLLGFGLDAYVAVGRLRQSGAGHFWVITRAAFAEITHWEPATGVRYSRLDGSPCPYMSVGCVFNHKQVYANCQLDDSALTCSYLLEDPSLWQELQVPASQIPGPGWSSLDLQVPAGLTDCTAIELQLEQAVKTMLTQHRQALFTTMEAASSNAAAEQSEAGVRSKVGIQHGALAAPASSDASPTVWDSSLEHLLMQALVMYEHEAVSGEMAPGAADFQTAMQRATPLGWVFKGVPQQHRHVNPAAIVLALLDDAQALEVLMTTGPGALLAFRAKVWAYPEGLFSTWVMLASKAPGADSQTAQA